MAKAHALMELPVCSSLPRDGAAPRGARGVGDDGFYQVTTSEVLSAHAALPILVEKYTKDGMNHNNPTYKKVNGPDDQWDVFIYYWDARDGADFCGWWFGSSVGVNQVWSRNDKNDPTPPRTGWEIP